LHEKVIFIAWRRLSRRTRDLAKALGGEIVLIPYGPPYIRSYIETINLLEKRKPRVIIAQLPQGPLLWTLIKVKEKIKYALVADVHTGFLVYSSLKEWILNYPFRRLLQYCELILVHNGYFRNYLVNSLKIPPKKVLLVYDPIPYVPKQLKEPKHLGLAPSKYIVFPSAWSADEPIEYVVREFISSKVSRTHKLVITGDYKRRIRVAKLVRKTCAGKVVLTGYLPLDEYYWVLANAAAILAVTKREYTMLSAIWEAIALSKPLIVSRTKTIEEELGYEIPGAYYFNLGYGSLSHALDKAIDSLSNLGSEGAKALRAKMIKKSLQSLSVLKMYIQALAK